VFFSGCGLLCLWHKAGWRNVDLCCHLSSYLVFYVSGLGP
jgi:hypothetical protein